MKNALLFPYSFVLMNWAAVAALYHFARGRTQIWNPTTKLMRQQNKLKEA
jgi:hypothetical protein